MNWIRTIRAYGPGIALIGASLVAMALIGALRANPLAAGLTQLVRWIPLVGFGLGFFYCAWVTWRLWQADQGIGALCPRCGGPLGSEKYRPYSPHRTCLVCGKHANERHYS